MARLSRNAHDSGEATPPASWARRGCPVSAHAAGPVTTHARRHDWNALTSGDVRVRLRPLQRRDLPVLWLLHSDPRVFALDTIGPLTTVDHMQRILEGWLTDWQRDGIGYFLVSLPESGPGSRGVLGVAGLSRMPLGSRVVANAYVRFFPEAWGHGYARAALQWCVQWAAHEHTVNPRCPSHIAFITAERNVPAQRLAEALGFDLSKDTDPTETGAHRVYLTTVGS